MCPFPSNCRKRYLSFIPTSLPSREWLKWMNTLTLLCYWTKSAKISFSSLLMLLIFWPLPLSKLWGLILRVWPIIGRSLCSDLNTKHKYFSFYEDSWEIRGKNQKGGDEAYKRVSSWAEIPLSFLQGASGRLQRRLPEMSQLHSLLYRIWKVKIHQCRHVVAEDLAQCNRCSFYCNYSTMKKMIQHPEIEKTCPMCNEDITLNDIQFLGEAGVSGMKRAPPPKDEKEKAKWLESKLIINIKKYHALLVL